MLLFHTHAAASVIFGTLLTSLGIPAWAALLIGIAAMGIVISINV